MRTLYLAMSEMEHDKRSWRSPGMVAASLILTLALHACLREQAALLREAAGDNEMVPLVFTGVATIGQIVAIASLMTAETPRGDLLSREPLVIIAVGHIGSMFLQAYLASLGNFSGSLAVAYTEPVLAVLALWAVTSIPARLHSWIGLISVSAGCSLLSMSLHTVLSSDRTSLIQGLASFALVLKNIVLRHLVYNEKVTVSARDSTVVTGFVVFCGCVIACVYTLASPIWIGPTFCALTTMLLSTAWLFVNIRVLKSYNVVFTSLFHIVAILVEAQVLMSMARRPDWVVGLTAVVVLLVGAFLYLKDWVDRHGSSSSSSSSGGVITFPKKPVNTHEQYTRIEFLLFSSMVVGVIFYVFQPKLSQRDLKTLSYVGLDKVLRRLLSVE